jgi:NADP-dependent 3-hydroxy acid dehydrogenase YdfG
MTSLAIILGVGPGLGSALARKFAKEGYQVAMLARNSDYLSKISDEITKTGGNVMILIL